jgi:hypothetical protein
MKRNRLEELIKAGEPTPIKLIVSNIPRSARLGDLWEFLSQFCKLADLVINESPISKKRWALAELANTEPSDPQEQEGDDANDDDEDEGGLGDSTLPNLDDRSVDKLVAELNGQFFRDKRLKVKRRVREKLY